MAHELVFHEESGQDIVFRCAKCGAVIGFNKPGVGVPSPIPQGETWIAPPNPDQWMQEMCDE